MNTERELTAQTIKARDIEASVYDKNQEEIKSKWFIMLEKYLIRKWLRISKDDYIVDAGCGTGRHTVGLLRRKCNVFSVDMSMESLRILKDKNVNAQCVLANVAEIPFKSNSIDKIICNGVLQHIPELTCKSAVREFHRILKLKGDLVFTVWNSYWPESKRLPKEGLFQSGIYFRTFDRKSLLALCRDAGFDNIEIRGYGFFFLFTRLSIRGLYRIYKTFPILTFLIDPILWKLSFIPFIGKYPIYFMVKCRKPQPS
ncbi:class I SAM-dependent methyltransferase [Verrucomicrobiota bacterium]